ncbi:hypothetical protein ABER60_13650, partial [Heyndrickxia coagulans]|uniref:hypothetical protein n=1 Tax=Heyndrickxia coagulans TaxID=1398 RepID=UPI003D1F7134
TMGSTLQFVIKPLETARTVELLGKIEDYYLMEYHLNGVELYNVNKYETLQVTADMFGIGTTQVSRIKKGERRTYLKQYVDTHLNGVKLTLTELTRLKWLFDDIHECSRLA